MGFFKKQLQNSHRCPERIPYYFINTRIVKRTLWCVSLTLICSLKPNNILADQVIPDDIIVQGSLCVGADCVNNEVFSFDTVRLKGNDLRLAFVDTSVGTFPSNDWEITANDLDNGTVSPVPGSSNYLAITDATSGNQVFRVDAGAPALSLHIDSSGNLNLNSTTARITNLANPVSDTDAVNQRALYAAFSPTWLSSSNATAAQTSGTGSTAVGAGASARTNDTALGYNATITADNSTAIGANTLIQSAYSVAIGANATVEAGAEGGTAIGQNAKVVSGAMNSVALGKDSLATEPNTVSVGSPGNERRITNVANGISRTDAVNTSQLNQVSSKVKVNTGNIAANARNTALNREDIIENSYDIAKNSFEILQLQEEMDDSYAGIAAAASLIALSPSAPGKTTFNIGAAQFKGESAIGVMLAHRLKRTFIGTDMSLTCGFSTANGETLTAVGGLWNF